MARALMCPPEYYGIRYEINPWMRTSRDADAPRAKAQWQELYHALTRRMGVQVELIEPDKDWPDMVFTANAGLAVERKFVVSNFRHPQRAGEACLFWKWFTDRRYTCIALPQDRQFEGEGDALWAGSQGVGEPASGPPTLLAGHRFRSDLESHQLLGDLLHSRVVSLELSDERFYHLDTCLAPLDEKTAIWYPPAFDEYARRALHEVFAELVELEPGEALRFAANAVVVGKSVVLNAGCRKLSAKLTRRGYEVLEVDLSEFIKAGGAAKCLVLWLERG